MTTKKAKKTTLRQQLRVQAAIKLEAIKDEACKGIDTIALSECLSSYDLIKSIGKGSSKTADHNLVTQLANKAERELVKLWNDQQSLDLKGDDDA